MSNRRAAHALLASLPLLVWSSSALAEGHPGAGALLRLLGPRAALALTADGNLDTLSALVRLPVGTTAASLGLEPVAPGLARLRGGAKAIVAFDTAHPEVAVEIAPPLHPLLDKAAGFTQLLTARLQSGATGLGALVGVADTGLDVSLPDFLDANGHSRVAWILDLSSQPLGIYPDLEQKYGITDSSGALVAGAVAQGTDLDAISAAGGTLPTDEVGHGTHVTSIAAGNGGVQPHSPYEGFASASPIIFARITRDTSDSIDNDDLVRGVQFIFDRADAMQEPVAVNMSVGSDFGPHDGTMAWEEALAANVGSTLPGHALVAAAGNSGSIVDSPVHQSVRVSSGATMSVPITTYGAKNGALEVWITLREGATLSVGLDGPSGTLVAPVPDGTENGNDTSAYNAGVINGSGAANSPVPSGSHGAVALIDGAWPAGTYSITLSGEGTADLFLESTGDAIAGFANPVREGTVSLPATNPNIIAVGCTINRTSWIDVNGDTQSESEPVLDAVGGLPLYYPAGSSNVEYRNLLDGEMCWFSGAGPTVTGVPKPEIAAPGGIVIAAMSQQALPDESASSIFASACPPFPDGGASDGRCLEIDPTHGVSQGTSMAAPMVTGTLALLLARDPTLTQTKLVDLLQAGAHPFRGPAPYDDQSGPGELDVAGALDALEQSYGSPGELLPVASASWITLSSDYAAADGSTPVTAILELRTASGLHRADLFDPTRLVPVVLVGGARQPLPTLVRRAPGLWSFSVTPPVGMGGSALTLGATFDGQPIVTAKSIPIAADIWQAEYPTTARGDGCAVAKRRSGSSDRGAFALVALAAAAWTTRRLRRVRLKRTRIVSVA